MPPAFDPYRVKVAVSTGAKGGANRFAAGRVRLLKNEWKALGLHVVAPADADYLVVPDGVHNPGRSGRYATLIHYSDFVELLSRAVRPVALPRTHPTPIPTPRDEPEVPRRWLQHDVSALERRLRTLSERPAPQYQPLASRPTPPQAPTLPRADPVLAQVAATDPALLPYTWLTPQTDFAAIRQTVAKLRALVPRLQPFVNAALADTAPVYPLLYTSKQRSLATVRQWTVIVLTFWQELRLNLEVLLGPALPPRIDLEAWPVCDVPAHWALPYDLTSCWTHLDRTWSDDNVLLFTRPDLVSGLDDRARAGQYFASLETNWYLNLASLQCAQRHLQQQFVAWVRATRERFRTLPRCTPEAAADRCAGQFCVFYDQRCHEKPILFVLEELAIAFCGSTDELPITAEDYVTLNRFHRLVTELYRTWYGHTRLPGNESLGVCADTLAMVQTLLATVKQELRLEAQQDVFWSDLPALLPPDVLQRNWNDPDTVAALRDTVRGPGYAQRVHHIGATLLQL